MSKRSSTDLSESPIADLKISQSVKVKLQKLVDKISTEFKPDYIYLFGSHARKEAKKQSAYDILIIGETKLRFLGRIKSVLQLSRGILTVSPLFYTSNELELLKKNNDGFMASVLEDAKLLYKHK